MKTNAQRGWVANAQVGVVRSLPGLRIAGLAGIAPARVTLRFGVAIARAALLIFLLRKLEVFRTA